MLAPLVNLASTRAGCKKFMAAAKGKATLDGKPVTPERMEDAVVHVTSVADNPATGMGVRPRSTLVASGRASSHYRPAITH
ncbi:hypothetical protein [Nonomuraea sp. NPDC048901]|uniref:hypothetical protein n=1 Tax=Nonomuraea sp. NPDC048901 TaxID=3155627 RepID=UPI0033E30901